LLTSLSDEHPLRHQLGAGGQPVPHQACLAGQHWQWEGVDFSVLHPTPDEYANRDHADHNAMSCVLRVSTPATAQAPSRSVLITADIEAEQEAAILGRSPGELKSDVLIVPHHGSRTSSTPAFLRAVNPVQSVIQVGRRNGYKHPSKPVLARYGDMGLAWQATPDCGAYVWSSLDVPRVSQAGQSANSTSDEPRLGHCWRHEHHRYWDVPAPIKPDADAP
jgi:competence protein ComEC